MTINSRSWALSLVLRFLEDNRLDATLNTLKEEAEMDISRLEYLQFPDPRPLPALLEDLTPSVSVQNLSLNRTLDQSLFTAKDNEYIQTQQQCLSHVHSANILAVANCFINGLSVVVSGSTDKKIQFTDREGAVLGCIDCSSPILSLSVHPLGQLVAASCMDGSVLIVDPNNFALVSTLLGHGKYVNWVGFSPFDQGRYLVSTSYDHTVRIYEQRFNGMSYEFVREIQFNANVESACFLNTTATDPGCLVLGVRDDPCLTYVQLDPYIEKRVTMNANGDTWVSFAPMHLSPSPDSQYLAVYTDSPSGRIIVMRSHTSQQVSNLYGTLVDGFSHPKCVWDVQGRFLYATSDDYRIFVFDVPYAKKVGSLEGHEAIIRGLCLTGNELVSCSFDQTIRFWSK
jgi:WD40 repeat protein